MSSFRDSRVLPADLNLSAQVAERMATLVAGAMLPDLERSVGAIDWQRGAERGTDWTAEGRLPDGTAVTIALHPKNREIALVVDTNPILGRARDPRRWMGWLSAAIIACAIVVGIATGSAAWGGAAGASGFLTWIALDIALQVRSERAAEKRILDLEEWRRRFDKALDEAYARVAGC